MSEKVVVTKAKLTAIADEIRSKLESADTYTLDDMPDAIESISGGGTTYEKTKSGSIITVKDALAKPLVSCETEINAIQSGSGDPSPSNIRAISGFDDVKISVSNSGITNKNLLPPPQSKYIKTTKNGITLEEKYGVFKLSGTSSSEVIFEFNLDESVDLSPTTNQIAFNNDAVNNNVSVYFYRDSTLLHYWVMNSLNRIATGWTDTGDETINKIVIRVLTNTTANITIKPMLCLLTESNTSYVPYKSITTTITLDDTCYGGTLDVTNGVLTVDKVLITLKGTENWLLYQSETLNQLYITSSNIKPSLNEPTTICDRYISIKYNDRDDNYNTCYAVGGALAFNIENMSVNDWKDYLAQNNIDVVYTLNTPVTVDLDPTTISLLQGTNNIYADSGDMEITYLSDNPYSDETLVSEFDFKNDTTYTDTVRGLTLDSNMHGNISIVENTGLVNTQGDGWCRTLFALNPYETYRIEIKFGYVDPSTSISSGKKAIINYGRNGNTDNFFGYDFDTSKFYCKSGSGNQFSATTYDANYLKNKTLNIYSGCNFINGVLTKTNDFNLYFYVDGDYIVFGNQTSVGDIAQLGLFRSSDGFYNATIKSCKIYRLNNLPEAAV